MGLSDRIKQQPPKEVVGKKSEEQPRAVQPESMTGLTANEFEFLIRLIGDSNFKGNNLMFIYELVQKLQAMYLKIK